MGNSGPICQRKATKYLKVPLTSTEQIYLIFLIPIIVNCVVYIIHFSADFVVAVQHFRENNLLWGLCTIGFMYAPATIYFILTISRPDWWMTNNDKITKGVFLWFCLQVLQLIVFPLFALYRYAGLIVLTVDALRLSNDERTKTLNIAAAPAAIELYFFLQAWFQSIPQAIFQTHLLFQGCSLYLNQQAVIIRMLSIMMSIVIVAVETACFQRFESQRINGRKLPWAMWLKKYCVQELNNLAESEPLKFPPATEQTKDETIRELRSPEQNNDANSTQENIPEGHVSFDRQVSVTPPLPPKNMHITPPPTPLRGITTVAPIPIPDELAPPRPDSVFQNLEEENIEEMKTSGSNQTSNPNTQSLIVPSRKYSSKGLEQDDPVGKLLAFLWWFCFVLARMFTIVVFYEFYPFYLLGVLGAHYALMLLYLFYYTKYYDAITFFVNMWLGLVYIFSLIEYRIKFKYANRWLLPYYVLVLSQNTILTLIWYFRAEWDGFWYTYIFCAIFTSMLLCISSTIVYHVLFKPKKSRVYSN